MVTNQYSNWSADSQACSDVLEAIEDVLSSAFELLDLWRLMRKEEPPVIGISYDYDVLDAIEQAAGLGERYLGIYEALIKQRGRPEHIAAAQARKKIEDIDNRLVKLRDESTPA